MKSDPTVEAPPAATWAWAQASRRMAGALNDDIFWDTVASIDCLGEQPVFDASVAGTHNFIADGVVAHNSWEQDADVVIGLYRDELVHSDTDAHGVLELNVLKNRHSGQRPPFTAKAVWQRGRYWEWDRNSYADRDRGRGSNGGSSVNGAPPEQPLRLP